MERKVTESLKLINNKLGRIFFGLSKEKCIPRLSPVQLHILGYLVKNDNVNQRDLENILKIRRATVSDVLKTMEKNCLINRIQDENDKRSKKVILSLKSKEFTKNIDLTLNKVEKQIKKNIDSKDLEIFYKVLDEMNNNIDTL